MNEALPDVPDNLHAANTAYDAGRYSDSVTVYRRHLAIEPASFEGQFSIGAAFEALRADDDASVHFLRAATLKGAHLAAWQRGLMAAARARQCDRFADAMVRFIAATTRHAFFWKWPYYVLKNAGEHHLNRGDKEATFALLNAVMARSRDYDRVTMSWFVLLLGGYFRHVGDDANAVNCFRFAARDARFLEHAGFGSDIAERVASVTPEIIARFDSAITFADDPAAACDAVVLCAADGVYFKRYAPLLALSVDIAASRPLIIHFHIVDGGADCVPVLETIRASLRHCTVTASVQNGSPPLDADSRRTYYTCVRFMVADLVRRRHPQPLLIADIDGVFIDDPMRFVSRMTEQRPVQLLYGPDQLDAVYNAVGGGLVGLHTTALADDLLRLVKRHMLYWYERRRLFWFFDQMAWVAAVEEAQRRHWPLTITRLMMDAGTVSLGDARFHQILERKRDDSFNDSLAAFVSDLRRDWISGGTDRDTVAARLRRFCALPASSPK